MQETKNVNLPLTDAPLLPAEQAAALLFPGPLDRVLRPHPLRPLRLGERGARGGREAARHQQGDHRPAEAVRRGEGGHGGKSVQNGLPTWTGTSINNLFYIYLYLANNPF